MRDKFDFLHEDKHQDFLQAGFLSFLVAIVRHAQSTQNNKFAKHLQYLKKKGSNEVDFLHADKHQTLLKVDIINFGGRGQSCPTCLK